MAKRLRSKNMVWTLNAPASISEEAQRSWIESEAVRIDRAFKGTDTALFIAYQMERVSNSHLQGMIQWSKRTSLKQAKALLGPTTHIEKMSGTPQQALAYCQKEDTRIEGTIPVQNGEFQDFIAVKKAAGHLGGSSGGSHWLAIREAIKGGATLEDIRDDDRFVGHAFRYDKAIERFVTHVKL